MWGPSDVVFGAALFASAGLALAAPFVAMVRLRHTLRDRRFRSRLAALLAGGVALAVVAGWAGLAGVGHFLMLLLITPVVALLLVAAVVLERRKRRDGTGSAAPEGAVRSLWAAIVVVAMLAFSLPAGWAIHKWEERRAKRWVEAVAAVVRAAHRATGSYPASLGEIVDRVGSPPRFVHRSPGYGYERLPDGFLFEVDDPTAFLVGGWTYRGPEGTWKYWVD